MVSNEQEPVIFQCGFRRFEIQPIYSQAIFNCSKSKYERFLHNERGSMASIFGPVTFPPMPLIVLSKPSVEQPHSTLVALGSLHSVDPDRIVLKKIVLTARPVRIYTKHVVLRDMFYNPGI
jgi:pre-rRNA-processing protein TSR1